MARKSRKNLMPQAAAQEAVQQNEKELLRTAAYARLSVENGGHETEDSLHTQILQIHNYIRENPELTLTDTYADNGFTGTRFDRPEFERMMQDVRTGKIQCIVVKDLSRFGRDYIETGSYLETIFPMLHVRFIAINDDFDNIRQSDVDSLAVPIKNMVNSLYAKDISKKISLSYQMRREKGIPTSWCTPYGYQLNQQGNKFEATEDTDYQDIKYRTLLNEKTMANLRMIDWPDELGTAHPRTFIAEDYDTLMKCKALFARKFDSKVDSKIIKLICQSLENG